MRPFEIPIWIALVVASLVACAESVLPGDRNRSGDTFKAPGETWVATAPTQCLTNPWEQDWLSAPGHEYADYPRDFEHRLEIIRDYYAGIGVSVVEGTTEDWHSAVCLACSCPAGYTLYLLVPDDDVDTMLDLGYRREAPVEK